MTDIQFIIVITLFFMIRYDLDGLFYNYIAHFFVRPADDDENFYDDSNAIRDSSLHALHVGRNYDSYDERIERMRAELQAFNSAPSNAETSPGTYNLPHEDVVMPIDMEPAVEEECELGPQEYSK